MDGRFRKTSRYCRVVRRRQRIFVAADDDWRGCNGRCDWLCDAGRCAQGLWYGLCCGSWKRCRCLGLRSRRRVRRPRRQRGTAACTEECRSPEQRCHDIESPSAEVIGSLGDGLLAEGRGRITQGHGSRAFVGAGVVMVLWMLPVGAGRALAARRHYLGILHSAVSFMVWTACI